MSEHIIVVDDDPQLTGLLERYLGKQGFLVTCVATAAEFRRELRTQSFDLCILDLILPDRDGFEITKELRQTTRMPIIVLTARTEVYDRIVGLELGADDYITKPFEPRELLARIRAVLRRTGGHDGPDVEPVSGVGRVRFGPWLHDPLSRRVTNDRTGAPVQLTGMEYALIRALAESPGKILSRDQLLDRVHGSGIFVTDRAIDVHIARIRRKIERDPAEPEFIKTVRGKGYLLAGAVRV